MNHTPSVRRSRKLHPGRPPSRGIAVLLALLTVGLAALIGLAIASTRDANTTASGNITLAAEARSAAKGSRDIALFIVERNSEILAGDPSGAALEVFVPKAVGSMTLSAEIEDANTGLQPSTATVGVAYVATATRDGFSRSVRALSRAPWADTFARADLDLSEFGVLASSVVFGNGSRAGRVDVESDSEVSVWRDAPLADLGYPIVIGAANRDITRVFVDTTSRALGVTRITDGEFPTDQAGVDGNVAQGITPLPANIHVPAAPGQAIPAGATVVVASDLGTVVNQTAGGAVPRIRVEGDTTLGTTMTVTGPIDPGTWRVLAFNGALTLDGARWTFEVPTMLVATGGITVEDGARLEVAPGGALAIVSHQGVAVNDSYIGTRLAEGAEPDANGGAPYGGVGASRVTVYAQPTTVTVAGGSVVTGEIYAPGAVVNIADESAVYGRVLGGDVQLDNGRVFYDPALDNGRGWLNPDSGTYEGENDLRDAVLNVTMLNDESLAAFSAATSIAVDLPGNGLVVTSHVDAAGGTAASEAPGVFAGSSGSGVAILPGGVGLAGGTGSPSDYPATIEIHGVLRDFREAREPNGHPDFQSPTLSRHFVCWQLVAGTLGPDGKPRLRNGGRGYRSLTPFTDPFGNPIAPSHFDATLGDTMGTQSGNLMRAITSEASFASWFNTVPGVNESMPIVLELQRSTDASGRIVYAFDSDTDMPFRRDGGGPGLDGFFPLEGLLFGNSAPWRGVANRNFHFTLELEMDFEHRRGTGQLFTFRGDDDVWVFIDGQLVIDLGGMHSARSQVVHLDRLAHLTDGGTHRLKLFFAERFRHESNFRIGCNFPLASSLPPPPPSDPMRAIDTIAAQQAQVLANLRAGLYAPADDFRGVGGDSVVELRGAATVGP